MNAMIQRGISVIKHKNYTLNKYKLIITSYYKSAGFIFPHPFLSLDGLL